MPIKGRDGKEFKLRGPNPMMKDQEFWNNDGIVLLNMTFTEEVIPDPRQREIPDYEKHVTPLPVITREPIPVENVVVLPKPVPKPEPVVQPPQKEPVVERPKPVETVTVPRMEDVRKVIDLRKCNVYCLPCQLHVDDFYGTRTETWGTKFVFEAVIIDETDLGLKLWTNVELDERSIIFPQNRSKRWWRTGKPVPDSGGFLVDCTMSDSNPNFGD
jgi:hypothetical protein